MDNFIPQQGMPGLTPAPKKRNWLMIIGVIIVSFIAFVGLIIGCVFSMGRPVMQSGETFLIQLSAGNVGQAYESAAIQFKQEVTREQFDAYLKEFPVVTKVKSVSFNQFSIENDALGSASGLITATDGQVSPINMRFVKENDGWRVLYLDVLSDEQKAEAQQQAMQQQQAAQQAPAEQPANPTETTTTTTTTTTTPATPTETPVQ